LWNRYFEEADVFVWAMNAYDWESVISSGENEGKGGSKDDYGDDEESKEVRLARMQDSWNSLGEQNRERMAREESDDSVKLLLLLSPCSSAALRSHSHLTSLPLLILFTHMDKLEPARALRFQEQITSILQERMSELSKAEETELEEEMNQFDRSAHAKESSRQIWAEWQVVTCSAKDG
jgi:hypothetical protein